MQRYTVPYLRVQIKSVIESLSKDRTRNDCLSHSFFRQHWLGVPLTIISLGSVLAQNQLLICMLNSVLPSICDLNFVIILTKLLLKTWVFIETMRKKMR